MAAHRTSDYISQTLIVRRGQTFQLSLNLTRPMQSRETLSLTAETGPSTSVLGKTRMVMPLSRSWSKTSWSATRGSTSLRKLAVTINVPADAIIGRYRLSLQITSGGRTTSNKLGEFIVLFNCWALDDDVYMSSEAERTEYVLNEMGVIFYGSADSRKSKQWDYGQFEDGIVDTVLTILNKSLDYQSDPASDVSSRNSPIHVGRVLSAMVNNNDGNRGVVSGDWSGDYLGGVSPSRWNGSVPILRSWLKNGPVKYGQCWVYAGVLCTALRCLGIPSRVITNFESGHDTDRNLTIDTYFDLKGRNLCFKDNVWNFHVWNEGWFVRKDLGSSYNGWQILDATPQEKSHGIFRLGPTSQKAVKEGDVNLDYDGRFVFAEVNADTVEWVQYDDATKRRLYSESKSIGQYTSTKAVGSSSRVDVTIDYKYPEGTAKERAIFKKAKQSLQLKFAKISLRVGDGEGGGADMFSAACEESRPPAAKPNFTGKFKQIGESQVGQDVTVALTIKNTASVSKRVGVNLTATAIIYTGARVKEILVQKHYIILAANKEKNIPITIPYAQYESAITDDNLIKIVTVCEDEDDKVGKMLVEFMITLKNPPLLLKFHGQPVLNKPVVISITFCNPIAENVTNSILTLEGSGLCKEQLQIKVPLLKPNQTSKTEVTITPYRTGVRCLIADLSSDKFSNVKASQEVTVAPA
ncbi:protein-glutamine gamma-glutamyltransferase 6-like isoform X1 [Ascaphus truei]|uniref:protein-glutamine gamma-glutamyltransferase 6-like isoform X1 n=1 Tax=Ascaphus truei TaxID=8439 RepID=UPI003F598666